MRSCGFNEAAGIPRGRRSLLWRSRTTTGCFNEAAGIPRGRRGDGGTLAIVRYRFNEAAGIPRGRHGTLDTDKGALLIASMRPRVFPAEDGGRAAGAHRRRLASMRPRVFPAEDSKTSPIPTPV